MALQPGAQTAAAARQLSPEEELARLLEEQALAAEQGLADRILLAQAPTAVVSDVAAGAAGGGASGSAGAAGAAGAGAGTAAGTAAGAAAAGAAVTAIPGGLLVGLGAVGLAAAGGGGGGGGAPAPAPTTGQLFNGPIGGATVFRDLNGNSTRDANEATTTSNADGTFTLAGTGGIIIATGGTLYAGTANATTNTNTLMGVLDGTTAVLTPLTTLVVQLAAQQAGGLNNVRPAALEAAQAKVAEAFGLGTDTDILSFNPVTATDTTAANTYVAQARAIATAINNLVAAAPNTDFDSDDVFAGLVKLLEADNPSIDLTTAAGVNALVAEVAQSGGITTTAAAIADAIANQIQTLVTLIEDQGFEGDDAEEAFKQVNDAQALDIIKVVAGVAQAVVPTLTGSITAAQLLALDAAVTTGVVNATGVTSITGSAAEFATLLAAANADITLPENFAAFVTDTAPITQAQLQTLNTANGVGTVTLTAANSPALTGTAAALVTLLNRVTGYSGNISVTDGATISQAELATLNAANGVGTVTLQGTGTPANFSGTAAALVTLLNGVSGYSGNVTVNGQANIQELQALDTLTTGQLIAGTNFSISDTHTNIANAAELVNSISGTFTVNVTAPTTGGVIYLEQIEQNVAVTGSTGADIIVGGYGNDTLNGEAGNDFLWGGDGGEADRLTGGAGIDHFLLTRSRSSTDFDTITDFTAGNGGDILTYIDGLSGGAIPVLRGVVNAATTGNIVVAHGDVWRLNTADNNMTAAEVAALFGGVAGDNTSRTFAGVPVGAEIAIITNHGQVFAIGNYNWQTNSTIIDASDVNQLAQLHGFTTEKLNALTTDNLYIHQTINGTAGDDFLLWSDNGNDTIHGLAGNDVLRGYAGNDTLNGYVGNDYLDGSYGNDTLNGGTGVDHFVFEWDARANGLDTIADFASGANGDVLDFSRFLFDTTPRLSDVVADNSIGNMQVGHGMVLRVTDADNNLNADSIATLFGSTTDSSKPFGLFHSGRMVLITNHGKVWFIDGSTQDGTPDITQVAQLTGFDQIALNNLALNNLFVNETMNLPVVGWDVFAGAGNDTITGNIGNDEIYGGAGIDNINGGAGSDEIYGGAGIDNINGGAGSDDIFGNAGNDTINGGGDDDIIFGGSGNDTLTGGAGPDTFVFEWSGLQNGQDTITDFTVGATASNGDTLDFQMWFWNTTNNQPTALLNVVSDTATTPQAVAHGNVLRVNDTGAALTAADIANMFGGTNDPFGSLAANGRLVLIAQNGTGTAATGSVWLIDNALDSQATISATDVAQVATLLDFSATDLSDMVMDNVRFTPGV